MFSIGAIRYEGLTGEECGAVIKRLPRTADSFPIIPGDIVHVLRTRDSGKTWTVTKVGVAAIGSMRSVQLDGSSGDWWEMPQMGDNRIFRSKVAANAEAKRRTAAVKMLANRKKK